MYEHRVLITRSAPGHATYYCPTFPITNGWTSYSYDPNDETLLKDHGENGKNLFRALQKIPGTDFNLSGYQLEVKKAPALRWKEIDGQVLSAIRNIYGEFKIDRGNIMKRIAYSLRNNITHPLFPCLYR